MPRYKIYNSRALISGWMNFSSSFSSYIVPNEGEAETLTGKTRIAGRTSKGPIILAIQKKKGIKTKIYLLQFDFEKYSSFFFWLRSIVGVDFVEMFSVWDYRIPLIFIEFNRNHRAKIIKKSVSGRANSGLVWWDTLSKTHVGMSSMTRSLFVARDIHVSHSDWRASDYKNRSDAYTAWFTDTCSLSK